MTSQKFGRPLLVFPNAKVIVRKFWLLLCKSRCLHIKDICLLPTGSKLDVERFSSRHLAMAGTYTTDTFTITIKILVKPEARKNLPCFQILIFCNFQFSSSQNDVECWEPGRAMYVREPAFLKLTFQLFVSTFFTCSTSQERHPEAQISSNSVSMHS